MISILFFAVNALASQAQISFVAHTNMPGVSVEGKAQEVLLTGTVKNPIGAKLEFDVFQLETGMETRDKHLREKVFSAKQKGDARIVFEVLALECGHAPCVLSGKLSIKNHVQDFKIPVERSADLQTLSGRTQVQLSAFGLPRPSFMGVKVEEMVDVTFQVKE